MGYVHFIGGDQRYDDKRDMMHGGYALKCYECNRHTGRWVAAEMPNAAEDMCRAQELFGGETGHFYQFHHEYRISFPECGHQDVRGQWDVWRFYGPPLPPRVRNP